MTSPSDRLVRHGSLREELDDARALLAAQKSELARLERLAEDLVSLVSHELRTPATAVRAFVELAAREEGRAEALEQARQAAERLVRLIDDRLFAARIRAGLSSWLD
jgi:signal transduction histidine kinase